MVRARHDPFVSWKTANKICPTISCSSSNSYRCSLNGQPPVRISSKDQKICLKVILISENYFCEWRQGYKMKEIKCKKNEFVTCLENYDPTARVNFESRLECLRDEITSRPPFCNTKEIQNIGLIHRVLAVSTSHKEEGRLQLVPKSVAYWVTLDPLEIRCLRQWKKYYDQHELSIKSEASNEESIFFITFRVESHSFFKFFKDEIHCFHKRAIEILEHK